MYKLIATDCDGTILDSEGFMPKEIIKVFRQLKDMGIHILPVTGRNDIIARDYLDDLDIGCPIIGCNGATLVNFDTGERFFTKAIDKASVIKFMDICKSFATPCKIFTTDKQYTDSRVLYEGGINLITVGYKKKMTYSIETILVEDIYSVADKDNIIKCVVVNNDVDFVLKVRDAINDNIPSLRAVQSNWNCIDINRRDVSKGAAVLEYGNMLGITPEEIIAFGDSENDLSMIEAAGLGVAVENADSCLKEKADIICDTNDNLGVAKLLKKIYNI